MWLPGGSVGRLSVQAFVVSRLVAAASRRPSEVTQGRCVPPGCCLNTQNAPIVDGRPSQNEQSTVWVGRWRCSGRLTRGDTAYGQCFEAGAAERAGRGWMPPLQRPWSGFIADARPPGVPPRPAGRICRPRRCTAGGADRRACLGWRRRCVYGRRRAGTRPASPARGGSCPPPPQWRPTDRRRALEQRRRCPSGRPPPGRARQGRRSASASVERASGERRAVYVSGGYENRYSVGRFSEHNVGCMWTCAALRLSCSAPSTLI